MLTYEAYCLADPLFFDEQRETGLPSDAFTVSAPDGWTTAEHGIWRSLHPAGHTLPLQGWKIHVSATMSNADKVLDVTVRYCVEHGIAFKHLRSRMILLARNSKYAPREGSGKLVTVYPADEQQFAHVLAELSELLHDEPGPYILSDLRYGSGPLYVRYGAFAERWAELGGTRVLAVERPDGELVADERKPAFVLPDWVPLPECLAPHLAARRGDPSLFPYRVTSPLHFSNGGGVYRATRLADGAEVVLKEARPHAGLDRDGVDAVARLRREHEMLDRLDGIPGIPRAHRLFTVWEHHFLDMDRMPGRPLGSWLARNYPLTRRSVTDRELAEYTVRALALVRSVAATLAEVHRRGVVFGDLHPQNILVDDDDRVSLIDFELALDASDDAHPALGAPGFRATDGRTGTALDEHALAALRLWLFLPVTPLLELAPGKLKSLVDHVTRRFPAPANYRETVMAGLGPRPGVASTELDAREPDWSVVRKSVAQAILASATPERTDRLFPGDIETFRLGGACFGYGAAGVLHALHATGEGRYPEHERWLLDAVRRQPPERPGFLDGSHGIAYVLDTFGHRDAADELLASSTAMVDQTTDHGFASGLSGIALTRLYLGVRRANAQLTGSAETIGHRLAAAMDHAPPPGEVGRAGLHDGWSGPALLFIRLYEVTGDAAWLCHADRALDHDLQECVTTEDGSVQVRDGGVRTLPYVGVGSAGIALVLAELARVASGFASLERVPGLLAACRAEFCVQPGLYYGRAGLMSALAAHGASSDVDMHLAGFAWSAVPYQGGIAFPGNQLLRLSMDVVTGGAGVLLALAAATNAALDGHGAVLPFLGGCRSWVRGTPRTSGRRPVESSRKEP